MSKARELAELIGNAGGTSEQVLSGRRNLIINGGFDVWQRGTSQTTDGYGSVDRWKCINGLSGVTVSKATRGLHWQGTVGTTNYYTGIEQVIENVWQYLSTTTTVTVSFKVTVNRADNSSGAKFYMWNYETANYISGSELPLSGTSQTYSYTIDLSSINENDRVSVSFWLGDGDYIIENVQLELGSTATPFEHRSYGEELALCQRYYYKDDSLKYLCGYGSGTTAALVHVDLPVTMRAVPSLIANYVTAYGSGYSSQASSTSTITVYGNNISTAAPRFLGFTCDAEL